MDYVLWGYPCPFFYKFVVHIIAQVYKTHELGFHPFPVLNSQCVGGWFGMERGMVTAEMKKGGYST